MLKFDKFDKFDWDLPKGGKESYLTPSPVTLIPVDQTTSGSIVLSDSSFKAVSPVKLFCKDIISDSTGEFTVIVSGSRGEIVRQIIQSPENFIMNLKSQAIEKKMTITVTPQNPTTAIKMSCILGIFAVP